MMIDPTKKRKVSKKTKKSWRKNVDIQDVDKFLENKRLDERLGAPFSERPDSALFAVDKSRDEKLFTSKSARRALLKLKEPRCFAVLKPHTAVPDPISKRNRVRTPEERKNPITRRMENERKINGILKLKEKGALKNKAFADEKRSKRPKRGEFKNDIWEKDLRTVPELDNQWYTTDTVRHVLANTGRKRKRVPMGLAKKPSVLPAVEIPHPGTSYNPSFADHQNLLREVAEKQLKFEKEEAHLNRVTTKMFKKVSKEENEKDFLNSWSLGNSENSDSDDDDPTVKSVNPPSKNEKKTLQKRRKQKEQRQLALQRREQKVEKKKRADLYKLKLLKKQMEKKEKKEQKLREMREKNKERKAIEPKVLSKVKFEASDPDFKLGGELTGNLRNAEPAGNLLKDRYKSLQQRNIVAPGTLVLKRSRASVKKYIKADHKIEWKEGAKK